MEIIILQTLYSKYNLHIKPEILVNISDLIKIKIYNKKVAKTISLN